MLLVRFPDLGGRASQKGCSICNSSCIRVVALKDEVGFALFDKSVVLATGPAIVLVGFGSFASIFKSSRDRARSRKRGWSCD